MPPAQNPYRSPEDFRHCEPGEQSVLNWQAWTENAPRVRVIVRNSFFIMHSQILIRGIWIGMFSI